MAGICVTPERAETTGAPERLRNNELFDGARQLAC